MRLAYLAAGAGGMFCGSCMHDNRLAASLRAQGRDVVLLPLYTPLRSDEPGASGGRVYYGGINAYLQQNAAVFRHTPWFLDRLFDAQPLLRAVGRIASRTRPEDLGDLTLSILQAERGSQRKEPAKLIAALRSLRPHIVHLPNLMFIGLARQIRAELGVRVLCGLAGEDVFLDRLPQPQRADVFALIAQAAREVDGFVALTGYYARHAVQHFGLPQERVHRIPMGIRTGDFTAAPAPPATTFTIGYLARICPEKGLHALCEAFVRLWRAGRDCHLRVAGYLEAAERPYLRRVQALLRAGDVGDDTFELLGELSRADKLRFLQSVHVLAVPTTYRESKGFYVLEALAAGVPVVLPEHGAFPELVQATGGGLLHEPGSAPALADALVRLMDDPTLRQRLGSTGRSAVHEQFTADRMATEAWRIYDNLA